jgi:hypothetical protein
VLTCNVDNYLFQLTLLAVVRDQSDHRCTINPRAISNVHESNFIGTSIEGYKGVKGDTVGPLDYDPKLPKKVAKIDFAKVTNNKALRICSFFRHYLRAEYCICVFYIFFNPEFGAQI